MATIADELKILTGIPALSGFEDRLIAEVKMRLLKYTDKVEIDRLGNVTATFRGKIETEPTMLVFAHLDEVGLMVSKVEKDGFLRFERIGGFPEKTLPGQFVDVFTINGESKLTGLVGAYSHHLTPPETKMKVPAHSEMYIDLGLSSADEVYARGINIGSPVTYTPNFRQISEHRVTSKTLDNRIGIYLLYKLAEFLQANPPAGTVYLVASVQEEFNIRGVLPAFERLQPNASICVDITPACDTPDLKMRYNMALGGGPAITQMNFHGRGTLGGIIPNPKLRRYMELTAEGLNMVYQREVVLGVITDDAFSQLAGKQGTAMAHLSIPIRYSHAPIETADLRDIENGSRLLNAIVSSFNNELRLERGILNRGERE